MGPDIKNINKGNTFYGSYVGRDMHNIDNSIHVNSNLYINTFKDEERDYVVTRNANIKPVAYFTGRETELQELRQIIESGRKSVLVSGMGGIGKTNICRKLFEEYLTKHAENESGPFLHIGYIEYNGDMGSSLQNCLKFKQQDNAEQNCEAAWRELEYLASAGKLLLFIDNVNASITSDTGLERLKHIPGAIILTSRRTSFSKEFEPYRIGFLSTEQCREIYEKIRFENSNKKVAEEEVPDLEYIIDVLAARHTITVEFLAHLAQTKHWTAGMLREKLESNGFQLEYKDEEDKLINIQKSYETLYDLSELTEAERNILEAFSVFPYIFLSEAVCNRWLLKDAGVSEDDDILIGLYRKGWLQYNMAKESYAMHPVFAQFVYEERKPDAEEHAGLIEACQNCMGIPDNGSALECQKFIPFAEKIAEKLNLGKESEQIGFLDKFAHLLYYVGQYKEAGKWFKSLLKINRERWGENHLYVAINYNNIGVIYEEQGEYEKAKEMYEKSLRIHERVFGESHPYTARSYNNLGAMYEKQGEYEKATTYYLRAYNIFKFKLGLHHSYTQFTYKDMEISYYKWNPDGNFEQWLEENTEND